MSNGNITSGKIDRHRVVRRVLLVLGLVFILYGLLEGLAYRLWRQDVISHKAFASVYAPFFYLDHHWAWFGYWDDDYESLWWNEGIYLDNAIESGLAKDGVMVVHESNPTPAFFTLQDIFYFGLAAGIAGLGASLIYFPQLFFRVVSQDQAVRGRKHIRTCGFITLAVGIILLFVECRDLLIYGF